MILAIVGSRTLSGNSAAKAAIDEVLERYRPTMVVSGGAIGVDRMAVAAAKARRINTLVCRPWRKVWAGADGYRQRNERIARMCEALVRIVDAGCRTYGSGWTRDRAAELGRPTEEITIHADGTISRTSHGL